MDGAAGSVVCALAVQSYRIWLCCRAYVSCIQCSPRFCDERKFFWLDWTIKWRMASIATCNAHTLIIKQIICYTVSFFCLWWRWWCAQFEWWKQWKNNQHDRIIYTNDYCLPYIPRFTWFFRIIELKLSLEFYFTTSLKASFTRFAV